MQLSMKIIWPTYILLMMMNQNEGKKTLLLLFYKINNILYEVTEKQIQCFILFSRMY